MALALFDLDNTLIAGDSDHAWGDFLVEQGYVDGKHFRQENDRFYQLYQQGKLDIRDYLHFALQPLAVIDATVLLQLRQRFVTEKILPMRLTKADALIKDHIDAGDQVAIITSTNRFVTEPIAELLGIKTLLATELEIQNKRFTGRALGQPCFREGKIHHLDNWLQDKHYNLVDSVFYSDSINDLPLLQRVATPVAVDPDPALRQHAQAQGWSIISLRD
jgi:HAD superfamily hydrolase (TIGR01490 family)